MPSVCGGLRRCPEVEQKVPHTHSQGPETSDFRQSRVGPRTEEATMGHREMVIQSLLARRGPQPLADGLYSFRSTSASKAQAGLTAAGEE